MYKDHFIDSLLGKDHYFLFADHFWDFLNTSKRGFETIFLFIAFCHENNFFETDHLEERKYRLFMDLI